MKKFLIPATIITAATTMASPLSIKCQEDNRFDKGGAFKELILAQKDGKYLLNTLHMASLNSGSDVGTLANNLECQLDPKSAVAYCENTEGQHVKINEVRRVFFEGLRAEKKTIQKNIEVTIEKDGQETHFETFNSASCDVYGGEKKG